MHREILIFVRRKVLKMSFGEKYVLTNTFVFLIRNYGMCNDTGEMNLEMNLKENLAVKNNAFRDN